MSYMASDTDRLVKELRRIADALEGLLQVADATRHDQRQDRANKETTNG